MSVFVSGQMKEAVLGYYEMLLEKSGTQLERLHIPTRVGDTFALAAGDPTAPALVLLHGSSMNSSMWAQDMKQYANSYRVFALDLPGEPGHSVEKQLPFDTGEYVDWLLDVLDGLQIHSVALVGASLGGWLAAKFAMAHPQRVSKLALLCPAGIGSQNGAFQEIAMGLLGQGEQGVDALFVQINGGHPIPEVFLNYQKLIAAGFRARQEAIPPFSDEALRSLTMPGLVIVGEKDILLRSEETVERVHRLLPHMSVVLLPEVGHSITGQTERILEFLS